MANYSDPNASEQEKRLAGDELFNRIKENRASADRFIALRPGSRPRKDPKSNAEKQRDYRDRKREREAASAPSALAAYVPSDEAMVVCEIMVASWHAQGSPQARQVRPSEFPQIAAHVAILIHCKAEGGRLPTFAAYAAALTAGTGRAFDRHRARNVLRRVQAILDADDVSSRGVKT